MVVTAAVTEAVEVLSRTPADAAGLPSRGSGCSRSKRRFGHWRGGAPAAACEIKVDRSIPPKGPAAQPAAAPSTAPTGDNTCRRRRRGRLHRGGATMLCSRYTSRPATSVATARGRAPALVSGDTARRQVQREQRRSPRRHDQAQHQPAAKKRISAEHGDDAAWRARSERRGKARTRRASDRDPLRQWRPRNREDASPAEAAA